MDKLLSNRNQKLRLTAPSLPRLPLVLRPLPTLTPSMADGATSVMGSARPRPIPPHKLEKALKKYEDIMAARTAKALADRDAASTIGLHTYLTVPPPGSTTSRSSRAHHNYARSISEHDAVTDRSSVMSFQGDEQPSQDNPLSFTGQPVKQRERKRFPPVERLETALVRYLGACTECNSRGVRCQLEKHHDVETLRRIISERRGRRNHEAAYEPSSSTSGGSQLTARSPSGRRRAISATSQQDFLGVGAGLLASGQTTPVPDLQSPGGDFLEDITVGSSFPTFRYQPVRGPDAGTERYAEYGNGATFLIGIRVDNLFLCRHASGCEQLFQDQEELERHFEYSHFPYTRIHPAIQHVCLECTKANKGAWIRCEWCYMHDTIQTRVHGHFIRPSDHSYYPETGPAPLRYDSSSGMFYGSAQASSAADVEAGPNPYDDFGQEFDPNIFLDGQDSNPYGGPSDQGYSFNGFDDGNTGTDSFSGNFYGHARQLAMKHSLLHLVNSKVRQHSRRLKHLLFLLLSFIAVIIFLTHDELIRQAQSAFPQAGPEIREHLSTIGFIFMVISFGVSFVVKHRNQQSSSLSSVSRRYRCSRESAKPSSAQWAMLSASACPLREKIPTIAV